MNAIAHIHTLSGIEPLRARNGGRSIFALQKLAVNGCRNTSTEVHTFMAARYLHGMALEAIYA
jgi:hypothetical protein